MLCLTSPSVGEKFNLLIGIPRTQEGMGDGVRPPPSKPAKQRSHLHALPCLPTSQSLYRSTGGEGAHIITELEEK